MGPKDEGVAEAAPPPTNSQPGPREEREKRLVDQTGVEPVTS